MSIASFFAGFSDASACEEVEEHIKKFFDGCNTRHCGGDRQTIRKNADIPARHSRSSTNGFENFQRDSRTTSENRERELSIQLSEFTEMLAIIRVKQIFTFRWSESRFKHRLAEKIGSGLF